MQSNGADVEAGLPMRNGIFLAPFHPLDQDPTEALRRDLELISALDRFGYDEAWVGEHHSAGFEIISSPEVFSGPDQSSLAPAWFRCPTITR
jgi:hypothetical protein